MGSFDKERVGLPGSLVQITPGGEIQACTEKTCVLYLTSKNDLDNPN